MASGRLLSPGISKNNLEAADALPEFPKSCFASHEPDFRNTFWPRVLKSPARSPSKSQRWIAAASHGTDGSAGVTGALGAKHLQDRELA